LATVTMALSVAACFTPRSTSTCTAHSSTEAAAIAVTVLPSPNTGKKMPSVDLMSTRHATSARQHAIQ
jgi:hypothetical protein